MPEQILTQERLKEVLHYDPDTGVFTWIIDTNARGPSKIGMVAGWSRTGQYSRVGIGGTLYLQHRVAWLYMTGKFPKKEIDHKDQCKNNNAWHNLQDVTSIINSRNMPKQKRNSSGITGVYWCKRDLAYLAQIRINGKQLALYFGKDFFQACCARKSAEKKYSFSKNHGAPKNQI